MSSTFIEPIEDWLQGIIQNRVNPSLIAPLKKHLQSLEEDHDSHEAVNKDHKTRNSGSNPTDLLEIALEIRLQIFGYLLRADEGRICPHACLPYLFIHTNGQNGHFEASNTIFVSALLINRQLYFEMRSFLYSENLFYFENCLTAFHLGYDLTKCYHANRLGFPKKLFAAIGTHIRKIGFPLHFRFGTKRASIKAAETIKAEFKLLATHLPSLSTTRVGLFFTYKSLCQRFLFYLVRSCQLSPGKKIITVHATNRAKVRVGNILRIHLNGCLL